ncbi:hypothetical protein [Nocardiopsis flavescens]
MEATREHTAGETQRRLRRIRAKYGWLRGRGARDLPLFPPAPAQAVAAREEADGIALPEGYRAFVTAVADGGVVYDRPVGAYGGGDGRSPGARMDSGEWADGAPFPLVPAREDTDGTRARHGRVDDLAPWPRVFEYGPDWAEEVVGWTDDTWGEYPGLLRLGELGCGYAVQLVVRGRARGRVVATWNDERPPTFPPGVDFPAWYETWLDMYACGLHFPGDPSTRELRHDYGHVLLAAPGNLAEWVVERHGTALEALRRAVAAGPDGGEAGLDADTARGLAATALSGGREEDAVAVVCALSRGAGYPELLRGFAERGEGPAAALAAVLLRA